MTLVVFPMAIQDVIAFEKTLRRFARGRITGKSRYLGRVMYPRQP
jgi:hypothetical protein